MRWIISFTCFQHRFWYLSTWLQISPNCLLIFLQCLGKVFQDNMQLFYILNVLLVELILSEFTGEWLYRVYFLHGATHISKKWRITSPRADLRDIASHPCGFTPTPGFFFARGHLATRDNRWFMDGREIMNWTLPTFKTGFRFVW